jgi:hypothetical protein
LLIYSVTRKTRDILFPERASVRIKEALGGMCLQPLRAAVGCLSVRLKLPNKRLDAFILVLGERAMARAFTESTSTLALNAFAIG